MRTLVLMMSVVLPLAGVAAEKKAAAERKPSLAVTQLRSSPAQVPLASAVSGVVANELHRLAVFQVITDDQVRATVSLERQRQLLGASDERSAMAELAQALAADYLLIGEVNQLRSSKGEVLSVQLVLLEAASGKRVGSELVNAPSESALVAQLPATTVKLCSKVLAGKQGTLYVSVAERGAAVTIDDSLRGTSPLKGRLELPAGPHLVTVEKDGFVTSQKEIRILPGQHLEEEVALVPSPDFIARYEANATRMRIGGYVSATLAVAGLATAGWFQYRNLQLYGAADQEGTFAYHQTRVIEGFEDDRAAAVRLRTEIEQGTLFSWAGAGVAAAGALGSAFFFIWGDPPGKYKKYELLSASVAPTGEGAYASVAFAF